MAVGRRPWGWAYAKGHLWCGIGKRTARETYQQIYDIDWLQSNQKKTFVAFQKPKSRSRCSPRVAWCVLGMNDTPMCVCVLPESMQGYKIPSEHWTEVRPYDQGLLTQVMVSTIRYFHLDSSRNNPIWLIHIFSFGWLNHQLVTIGFPF